MWGGVLCEKRGSPLENSCFAEIHLQRRAEVRLATSTEEMAQGGPLAVPETCAEPGPASLYCLVSSFNEMYYSYYRGLQIRSKSQTNKRKLLGWVSKVTT